MFRTSVATDASEIWRPDRPIYDVMYVVAIDNVTPDPASGLHSKAHMNHFRP